MGRIASRNPIKYLFCAIFGALSNTLVTSLLVRAFWDPGLSFAPEELVLICGVIPGIVFGLIAAEVGKNRGWRDRVLYPMAFVSGLIFPTFVVLAFLTLNILDSMGALP